MELADERKFRLQGPDEIRGIFGVIAGHSVDLNALTKTSEEIIDRNIAREVLKKLIAGTSEQRGLADELGSLYIHEQCGHTEHSQCDIGSAFTLPDVPPEPITSQAA